MSSSTQISLTSCDWPINRRADCLWTCCITLFATEIVVFLESFRVLVGPGNWRVVMRLCQPSPKTP